MEEYRLRELPDDQKPREKLKKYGPGALKNYELIAVVLGKGTRKEDIITIAQRILGEYGSRSVVDETRVVKVKQLLDIGDVQSCQLVACFELGRRFFGKARKEIYLHNPRDVFQYLTEMCKMNKEYLRGLYLDVKNKLIHDETIAIGTLTSNLVHPREVFQPGILHSAVGIILAHNHPSGDPQPSDNDIQITRELKKAGKLLGIELLDHVIIGDSKYLSLNETRKI